MTWRALSVEPCRALSLDDVVQRRQHPEHAFYILLPKVQLTGLLQRLFVAARVEIASKV
jgi:hypothetical protein